ncbi:MAG: hypothetical protein ABI831_08145 [Betaproteobacteria bacterium]
MTIKSALFAAMITMFAASPHAAPVTGIDATPPKDAVTGTAQIGAPAPASTAGTETATAAPSQAVDKVEAAKKQAKEAMKKRHYHPRDGK